MIESQRLSIRYSCTRTFRNAGSRDHGVIKMPKATLAWRERSEGKKVPACESHLARGRSLAVLSEQY